MRRIVFAAAIAAASFVCAQPAVMNVGVEKLAKEERKLFESQDANSVQLGQDVVITVREWEKLSADARAKQKPVTLFINGLNSKLEPIVIAAGANGTDVTYRLARTEKNRELWRDILSDPSAERPLHLSVGLSDGQPLPLDPKAPNGKVMLDKITLAGVGAFWLVVIAVLGIGLLYYAATTDMLRNGPNKENDPQPFSLARTQMAFWFLLMIVAYILIWTFTGERDTIPATLLALLGISAATAMGAVMIDSTKEQRNAAATQDLQAQKEKLDASVPSLDGSPAATNSARQAVEKRMDDIDATITTRNTPKRKSSFLMDLLTDDNGQIAVHRYQIAGWTIVLGFIFIATVMRDLSMPEFSATLLALMGISSGTYLGFKLPS